MNIARLLAIVVAFIAIFATLEILWKWGVSGVLQGMILGLITFFVYKPAAKATGS